MSIGRPPGGRGEFLDVVKWAGGKIMERGEDEIGGEVGQENTGPYRAGRDWKGLLAANGVESFDQNGNDKVDERADGNGRRISSEVARQVRRKERGVREELRSLVGIPASRERILAARKNCARDRKGCFQMRCTIADSTRTWKANRGTKTARPNTKTKGKLIASARSGMIGSTA